MGAILLVFLMIWVGSGYLGVKLIQAVILRHRLEDPVIPPARIANVFLGDVAISRCLAP